MRRFLGLLCTLAAVAATFGLCAGQVLANHVACGDTVTADTTLDSDLSCASTAIVVGADGIRLDLGGHTVQSNTTAIDSRSRNDVTIEDGTTRVGADGTGVLVSGARNRIQGITAIGGDAGIWVEASSDSVVAGNSVSGASLGIFLYFTRDTVVTDNALTGNAGDPVFGYFPSSGILLWFSSENDVVRNTSASNGTDVYVAGSFNRVRLNRGRGSGTGVRIASGSQNVIERNNFVRTGTGISLAHTDSVLGAANENTVRDNVLSRSSVAGISLLNVGGDEIARNSVTASFVGIRVEETYSSRLLDNDVTRSADDGIYVVWGSGNVLEGNTASRNGGDGLEVRPSDHVVRANVANHNGDLGIEVIGSIDGGGNRARGNGNPLQCLNVDCTR